MTWTAADSSLGAWLRRVPAYLYLVDLVPGKRVLEIGCGTGFGAQFLASHGAGRVVAVDRAARKVNDARSRYRQSNLEFRCEEPGSIEMEDASIDVVFVPDGVEILRRRSVLGELRRLLVPEGHLVVCGTSADRRGARGGASFHEFRDRLERMFAPVRMIAQTPFVGFSLVEYGDEVAPLGVHVDTSLGELEAGEPEACDYVAVCGGPAGSRMRDWCLVQVPEGGAAAVVEAIGARAAPETAAAASIEEADSLVLRELRLRLEQTIEERARAQAQAQELREQVEDLKARAVAVDDHDHDHLNPNPNPNQNVHVDVDGDGDGDGDGATTTATALIARAMTAHRDVVRSLEISVEEGQAYAEELRAELDEAAARAASLDAARAAADDRASRLEAELRSWRTRASVAEGQLLRNASSSTAVVAPHPVVFDVGRAEELSSLQDDLARVRREHAAHPDRDVRVRLGRLEGEVDRGRDLLRYIEEGLAELEKATAREAADRAPSAWAAHRDQQLRELSSEVGVKDAEITILHVGVSALRARLKELIGEVRRAATAMRGRSAAEMQDVMDHLSARLLAFEERE